MGFAERAITGFWRSAWGLLIAANLVTSGEFFDVAVRDIEMAIAAYVLARMTEVREPSTVSEAAQQTPVKSKPVRTAWTA